MCPKLLLVGAQTVRLLSNTCDRSRLDTVILAFSYGREYYCIPGHNMTVRRFVHRSQTIESRTVATNKLNQPRLAFISSIDVNGQRETTFYPPVYQTPLSICSAFCCPATFSPSPCSALSLSCPTRVVRTFLQEHLLPVHNFVSLRVFNQDSILPSISLPERDSSAAAAAAGLGTRFPPHQLLLPFQPPRAWVTAAPRG